MPKLLLHRGVSLLTGIAHYENLQKLMLISYVRLDHTLYSTNYSMHLA